MVGAERASISSIAVLNGGDSEATGPVRVRLATTTYFCLLFSARDFLPVQNLVTFPVVVELEEDARAAVHEAVRILRDDNVNQHRASQERELGVGLVRSHDEIDALLSELEDEEVAHLLGDANAATRVARGVALC